MKLHFTLDLEEWFDAENIRPYVDSRLKNHSSLYVVDRILEFLDCKKVRGTFFCLGKTAQKNKHLISTIASLGHEIASHGWSHRLLNDLSREETYSELADTKALLEDLSGKLVIGYRYRALAKTIMFINASNRLVTGTRRCRSQRLTMIGTGKLAFFKVRS